MEPRCPKCTSSSIGPTRLSPGAPWACNDCRAVFAGTEALVSLGDVHEALPSGQAAGFALDVGRARAELEKPDGAIRPVGRFSDADELHGLVVDALEHSVIDARRDGAYLRIIPSAVVDPGPFLVVEPSADAPALAAGDLLASDIEDPIDFTIAFLRLVVSRAAEVSSAFRRAQAGPELSGRIEDLGRWGVGRRSASSGRRFEVLVLPIRSDARPCRPIASAAGLSLLGALADVAEKVEGQGLDPDVTALNLMVDWVEMP